MLTDDGPARIEVQRDREGSFEPVLIPKHERRFTGLDDKIAAMYACGGGLRQSLRGYFLQQATSRLHQKQDNGHGSYDR